MIWFSEGGIGGGVRGKELFKPCDWLDWGQPGGFSEADSWLWLMFVIGPSRGKPKMAKITSKCRHITLRQHKTDDNFKWGWDLTSKELQKPQRPTALHVTTCVFKRYNALKSTFQSTKWVDQILFLRHQNLTWNTWNKKFKCGTAQPS